MKLISMRICPYVQQVRLLLEAKKAKYEVEHIDASNRSQWLMDASPDGGEVPVLITDEGAAIFQSDAIVEYIDEVVGEPLLNGSPLEKAQDKAWARLASDNYLTQCSTQRSPDEATLNERMADLTPIFESIERHLKEGPYFHGAELSMVDLSWLPLLHRSAMIATQSGYDFLANYPKLKQWREALMQTGLHDVSVPEEFEEIFTEFYLSEETFVGQLKTTRAAGPTVGAPGNTLA